MKTVAMAQRSWLETGPSPEGTYGHLDWEQDFIYERELGTRAAESLLNQRAETAEVVVGFGP